MSAEVFELFPGTTLKRGISETPPVSFQFKLVNNVEP